VAPAEKPSEIPVRAWRDILLRVYNNISRYLIAIAAAGVTFYTLLAIFPAIAVIMRCTDFCRSLHHCQPVEQDI
jgi:membrane protein